jgi:hypothetical protein
MLLVQDTAEAARHAESRGFIASEKVPEVEAEKAKDEQAPAAITQMLATKSA